MAERPSLQQLSLWDAPAADSAHPAKEAAAPPGLTYRLLPAGPDWVAAVADDLMAAWRPSLPDWSALRVVVPNLHLAAELRQHLGRAAGRPFLLPYCDTLPRWLAGQPLTTPPLPDAERLLLLHQALAGRNWFDEAALWGIASELAALFDELTAAAVVLPDSPEALAERLETAYRLRGSRPLNFEARLVHELWHALAADGRPDGVAARRLQLATLADRAPAPLAVLLDGEPDAEMQHFLDRYAERQPVRLYRPAPYAQASTELDRLLAAAWPVSASEDEVEKVEEGTPLLDRAASLLAAEQQTAPLADRLHLLPTTSREREAEAAVAQVARWLHEGRQRIALIAQDRLTARRTRALLEQRQVLVVDESGWKLSTSRAAATLDALLEVRASQAYHRDLLDLLKSPYLFPEVAEAERKAAVFALEQAIRRASLRQGLPRFLQLAERLRDAVPPDSELPNPWPLAVDLLQRLSAAVAALRGKPTSLAGWLDRLTQALTALGLDQTLAADAAGAAALDLLSRRRAELDASGGSFRFAGWRDWLNREVENETFRDTAIASPVVITHLAAARLRPFDAALILGGDASQLRPQDAPSRFFNQSVRRELGLPTRGAARRQLRADLALLLAGVPRVAVTWQSEQQGEANLLAPELDQLATLHRLAWGDDLRRPLPRLAPLPPSAPLPAATAFSAPQAPAERLPTRLSVSAYAVLLACPYRFFARTVLGLGELDEVEEEVDKRQYGELVHRSLERFHEAVPRVSALTPDEALAQLTTAVETTFAPLIAGDYLVLGWQSRWLAKLPAYLDWQRQREAEGWFWHSAETVLNRRFPLEGPLAGQTLELIGRADRVDYHPADDHFALLDYKTRSRKALQDGLADDVQLAAYGLMSSSERPAGEAAYVAVDEIPIATVAIDDLPAAAAQEERRLLTLWQQLATGSPLPANGSDDAKGGACRFCEMRGMCRKDQVGA